MSRRGFGVTRKMLIAFTLCAHILIYHLPTLVVDATATTSNANGTQQQHAPHYTVINGTSSGSGGGSVLYTQQMPSLAQLNAAGLKKVNNHQHNHHHTDDNATTSTTTTSTAKSDKTMASVSPPPSVSLGSVYDLDADRALYERHLERTSVIYGLTHVANASNVNRFCLAQLKHLQHSFLNKETWAMKAFDASGAKPSGFVYGQNFWLGSWEGCNAVRQPVGITLSRQFKRAMHYTLLTDKAPFEFDYRVIYLRHNSPWQIEIKLMGEQVIHLGLCVPTACASSEIEQLTTEYVQRGLFVENNIYDIQPEVMYMKDMTLTEQFFQRGSFKLLTVLLAFTIGAMLLASHLRLRAMAEAEERKLSNGTDKECMPAAEPLWTPPQFFVNVVEQVKDFASCFDVIANLERLLMVKPNVAKEIPVINGLRSISAILIMVFHVFWFMYFTVSNQAILLSFAERFTTQHVSSAPLLVDVFFTVSGFLQTFNFLGNAQQMEEVRRNSFFQNVKKFVKMLFHRYLRIVPLYMSVICMVDLFCAYVGQVSVFHVADPYDQHCSRYWWRNLLFIQNFFPHRNMCLNWSWSLCCEMLFFVVATILLLCYAKRPKLVKSIVVLLLLATIGWTYIIGMNVKFQLSFDTFYLTGNDIYISPFVRVLPYILGSCVAWILREKYQSKLELTEAQEKTYGTVSIVLFLTCLYSTVWRDLPPLLCITLFTGGRFIFSLCTCWMIVSSATGHNVCWSRFLEAKIFQHINRLTYAIYLVNPFVINFFFSLNNASTEVDLFIMSILSTGFTVIVYFISIVFTLCFEIPYCNWSSKIQRRSRQKIN